MSEWKKEPDVLLWPFLEKVAGNQLSKIVAFIPVAGYLILFNDGLAGAVSFNKIAGVTDSANANFWVSSTAKLRLTFFGSIVLLSAHLGFRIWSPNALTVSKNDLDFSDRVIASYTLSEIKALERWVVVAQASLRTPHIAESEAFLPHYLKGKPSIQGLNERMAKRKHFSGNYQYREDYVRALAREWWTGQMHAHSLVRYLVLAFCILGYVMLAIPSIDIAQAVVLNTVF